MEENPHVPQLFRDIFKNAFLPYRDPETLREFLKYINLFRYDHSEQRPVFNRTISLRDTWARQG